MENTTTTVVSEPTRYGSSNEHENNLDDPLAKNITASHLTSALSKGRMEEGFRRPCLVVG